MTQRSVELVVGRLLTDEEFRQSFLEDPQQALAELSARGSYLTTAEIAALIGIDSSIWERVAGQVDPRIQKVSLKAAPNGEPK